MMQGAAQGLRTLMLATRVLDTQQWEAWNKHYQAAASSMVAREKKIAQVHQITQGCLLLAFLEELPPPLSSTGKQWRSHHEVALQVPVVSHLRLDSHGSVLIEMSPSCCLRNCSSPITLIR